MRARLSMVLIAALVPVLLGCDHEQPDSRSGAPSGAAVATIPGTVVVPLGNRPFHLYLPRSYQSGRPAALVVALHGYSSKAAEIASYFTLFAQADRRGFLLALPDGTVDLSGNEFWNATNACCDRYRTGVDDSGYLSHLIDTVQRSYTVDSKRVFVVGHSNGGFMAHRMACDHADQITAIASLAGVVWQDPARCHPSRPVSVLQIHGTEDETIFFTGGSLGADSEYPGAEETVARWRSMDGCGAAADRSAPRADLDTAVAGAETQVTGYACAAGTRVEFWRMNGGHHVPDLSAAFAPAVVDFLFRGADAAA